MESLSFGDGHGKQGHDATVDVNDGRLFRERQAVDLANPSCSSPLDEQSLPYLVDCFWLTRWHNWGTCLNFSLGLI